MYKLHFVKENVMVVFEGLLKFETSKRLHKLIIPPFCHLFLN